ncbi:MAG: carboxylesterase family protein [Candidatus Marinimicrobia bacterium]|jgi:para-nitrobenzyl esterase|nr:carboxylesterase family protein [Candidatus Neomarinimicrobiota bacterium]MBT3683618.1 carboxylesterase family protein [Candidatus Neomarinimicrobiota bacterium]MBT3760397.1 carboxylesterase family protein [Candidatus Neomarinimicrobiota bacterium]MBT3896525.1 carboxylesterase family protein [Candidatus Neomarinimicrobiota bacterium]MBT4173561.1 carboxylesterase family protein [Candidatus Neomarinimicrobiota bacterium]
MRAVIYLIVGIYLLSNSLLSQKHNNAYVKIKVENGLIEGFFDASANLNVFFGIPYAKPPVDDLRWKAPQPMDNWNGVLETKKFSAHPVQIPVWGDLHTRSEKMSEDCLYLNIWAPAQADIKGLPVLVYFYGGGLVAGDGAEPRYDGAAMAQKGIVAITVNYRLNIFGFFSHPELSAESPYMASGNYGLLDQNAALKWVHKNISSFGGDPDKITIAGESAGSVSASAHMASPLSRDLIAGVIGESGAAINPNRGPIQLEDAEKIGDDFAIEAGYATLNELRALSTEQLLKIYENSKRFGFPVTKDGYFYPKTLTEIFKAGEQAQVPLLVGWNSAEIPGDAFTQGPYTVEGFCQKVIENYPNDFDEILKLYPHETIKEVELSATALASDRFIVYHTWKWFDLHRKNSPKPVYRYLFDNPRPPLNDTNNTSMGPKPIGAAHAEEIEYCLGNLYLVPEFNWSDDDHKVSETMLSFFANFIITGNPNGINLPVWPAAKSDDPAPPVMIIKTDSKAVNAKNDDRYLLLDKVYGNN